MTPTTKSVDDSKASDMFDLWALRRGFNCTASIAGTCKTAVKGKGMKWINYDEDQYNLSERRRLVKSSSQHSLYIASRGDLFVVE